MAGRAHEVRQGDCICVIAARSALPWQKIWDAPENDPLREAGRHPNLLLPGDQLHIPEIDGKTESVATGQAHHIVLAGLMTQVHLTLVGSHEPLADEPYVIEYFGGSIEGTTDGEGKLTCELPATLARATLKLPARRVLYTLVLGNLDPVDTLSGAHGRLRNLGYVQGDYGEEQTHEALRGFRRDQGLDPSSELDDDTIAALGDAHGS